MDYILRATAGEGSVRVFIANTKETVQQAFLHHKTSPVMSAALGRALTAVSIMGSMLKSDDDLITIKIKGDGPGKGLIVTGDSKARVKGYPFNPIVDIPLKPNGKLDVQNALGEGSLTVIKDMGLKEPYVGQIPLVSGEIAEDLTYYFAKSEQTPSAVSLGVLVDRDYSIKQAGGFIIQVMPNADENIINSLETKLATIKPFTTLLEEGNTIEDILNILLGDFGVNVLDKIPVKFYCNCSKERVEKALISIGKEEIENIIKEDKKATLHCHFCDKDYNFNEEDLKNILNECTK
ncbi:Hsp33 family molecular chaperone HslO [uncultured Tyzzerella sp.]|uniref:Hsp33 family molecular chaperone HslO n=1 Tax=uncultured Tyzzerella sp. TaxID=2321398 RepID=UPI002941BBA7|nr:Hsp33 family molecular chaperone HslO [uncultured Tyzzerella sp.]